MKCMKQDKHILYHLILKVVTTKIDRYSELFVTMINDVNRSLSIAWDCLDFEGFRPLFPRVWVGIL